jgi:hypothetical protein
MCPTVVVVEEGEMVMVAGCALGRGLGHYPFGRDCIPVADQAQFVAFLVSPHLSQLFSPKANWARARVVVMKKKERY